MRTLLTALVLVVFGLGSTAAAQGLPTLQEGTRVWVTTADGREQEGAVVSTSPSGLVLRVDSAARSIALADLRRIEGRDRLLNGMRNGGIAGAAALGGFGLFLSTALCESPDGCLRNDAGPLVRIAALGAGIGIAAGALIDAAIKGRRVLYVAPEARFGLLVTPLVTTERVGVRVSVTRRR